MAATTQGIKDADFVPQQANAHPQDVLSFVSEEAIERASFDAFTRGA
jgi:hypothetical protein